MAQSSLPFVSPLQFISSCRMVGVKTDIPPCNRGGRLPSCPFWMHRYIQGCTGPTGYNFSQLTLTFSSWVTSTLTPAIYIGGPLSSTRLNEQGRILHQFMSRWDLASIHLHISDSPMSHTYSSEAHSSLSTIDHILCSQHLLAKVTSTPSKRTHRTPLTTFPL